MIETVLPKNHSDLVMLNNLGTLNKTMVECKKAEQQHEI
jgi:hypothetical protein